MQDNGGADARKRGETPKNVGTERNLIQKVSPNESANKSQTFENQNFTLTQQKGNVCKNLSDTNILNFRASESNSSCQSYCSRYINTSPPTFSSPPHSPLVGLIFDPGSPKYNRPNTMGDRNPNNDRRTQNTWTNSNQEPIGTGAKKKIVKTQDKRTGTNDSRFTHERYRDNDDHRKDRNYTSESTTSLDFFAEGEKMVSELCSLAESNTPPTPRTETNNQKQNVKSTNEPSDILLTALDKIVIHDQIPNQIVQLAIEACTDAENIAIAHHNRPCFKNIHSICAKTRSNVQKPDSAVANLHSQGIPWVIKNFIFSFVRILDGWKGVKELLSEKHDTFSRIENKYYSPDIRECFVQWQAVTKEMLAHIYKTFKCLDHGFTMEQKSFTHNYYSTNSAGPRHQNQNKFQSVKPHVSIPRCINSSPQSFNVMQPPWVQNQSQQCSQSFMENTWPARPGFACKKIPVIPAQSSHNFFSGNEHSDLDVFQKTQYKEAKPRQSWTITNIPDFRAIEGLCQAEQREIYAQLKHKIDAELCKTPSQPNCNAHYDLLLRREMELKSKMIPLSHVEKTLIPNMSNNPDMRSCYLQKMNSCGDTKEENDFFATWGQMVQKEPNDFITHQSHDIQISSSVMPNVSGPMQYVDRENDEFQELSKVYMKPGSYKVPIKPDNISLFAPGATDVTFDNSTQEDISSLKMKVPFTAVTLAPHPKYNLESWPCVMPRHAEDIFGDDKQVPRQGMPFYDLRHTLPLDILNSMTSDKAWEAAKQSAPKLVDFVHDSKSDTARLYDALGLNTEDFQEAHHEIWHSSRYLSSGMSGLWDQDANNSYPVTANSEPEIEIDTAESKNQTKDNVSTKAEQSEQDVKVKPKVVGNWYQPKKKKPLPAAIIKRFEILLSNLSQIHEAKFIQNDMDIKVAPRFYEVVRHPMCLHDIAAKLKSNAYSEQEQVVQDFRRIFNNVRLYLKTFPDAIMRKSVNKVSADFERLLNEEFQIKNKDTETAESVEKDANEKERDGECKNEHASKGKQ